MKYHYVYYYKIHALFLDVQAYFKSIGSIESILRVLTQRIFLLFLTNRLSESGRF